MEQIRACKQVLKIAAFPESKLRGYGYVGSAELIVVVCLLSLVWSALARSFTPHYLLVGAALPLYLMRKGVQISHYWECFAFLLLVRRLTAVLAFLDVLPLALRSSCCSASGTRTSAWAAGWWSAWLPAQINDANN